VLRKIEEAGISINPDISTTLNIDDKEKQLLKLIYKYPQIVKDAGDTLSPALIANYAYELAKEFNQFYHDFPIIKAEVSIRNFRLIVAKTVGKVIESAMGLLGIEVPERM